MSNEAQSFRNKRGMSPFTFALTAGVERTFEVEGDFFHVLTAPVADLRVRFDDGPLISLYEGVGLRTYFSRFTLESATGQTVTVLAGFGHVSDGRATANVNVNASLEPSNSTPTVAPVTAVAGAQTALVAANAGRKAVRVSVPSDAVGAVYIGDSDVSATLRGALIEPGITDYFEVESALYVWNPNGSDVTVYALELNRV